MCWGTKFGVKNVTHFFGQKLVPTKHHLQPVFLLLMSWRSDRRSEKIAGFWQQRKRRQQQDQQGTCGKTSKHGDAKRYTQPKLGFENSNCLLSPLLSSKVEMDREVLPRICETNQECRWAESLRASSQMMSSGTPFQALPYWRVLFDQWFRYGCVWKQCTPKPNG